MAYELHWANNCVEWRYSGLVTGREIIDSNNEIYGDERFDDLRYQIVDLSAAESLQVSEKDMKHMAHLDRAAAKSNPRIKVAVIAPSDSARQVVEAYEKYTSQSSWETAAFDDRDAAIKWLGL